RRISRPGEWNRLPHIHRARQLLSIAALSSANSFISTRFGGREIRRGGKRIRQLETAVDPARQIISGRDFLAEPVRAGAQTRGREERDPIPIQDLGSGEK